MKRIKEISVVLLVVLGICGIIYGVGLIKYKIWRAEHPQAETWTFFIPSSK